LAFDGINTCTLTEKKQDLWQKFLFVREGIKETSDKQVVAEQDLSLGRGSYQINKQTQKTFQT